jgi:hypothetical protein
MRSALVSLFLVATPLIAVDSPVATILSYHDVLPGGIQQFKMTPRPGAPDIESEEDRYTVKREDFVSQLDYLDQNGYHVISLEDLINYIEGRRTG